MDHSPEPEQPGNVPHPIPPPREPPALPSLGSTTRQPPPPPPPRPPGQLSTTGAAPRTVIVPEAHWMPRGGSIAGIVPAVRDLLESYSWVTWWRETRKALAAKDVTDIAGPMAVFGMRLRQRTTNTLARDLMILILILASPFVVEAAALTMLEIVKTGEDIQAQVFPGRAPTAAERSGNAQGTPGTAPSSSPVRSTPTRGIPPAVRTQHGFQHDQLLYMVKLARPLYSTMPYLLALAVIALHTWRNCCVPFHEHAYELNRMTRMQSLNMIYACWGYYLANMLPSLSLMLPAVLARSAMWNTSLQSELAILCVFSGVLVLGSGKPISIVPDPSAKDANGKQRKAAGAGCTPGGLLFLFFFLGLPLMSPLILLIGYLTRLPLLPLVVGFFLLLPWIVFYRLLNTAEPWRYQTENYTLPRRLITWGTLISGAAAGLVCGWPGWITMLPGGIMMATGYMAAAPKILEDVAPAAHFAPFQTHGRLWQLLGRLAYPGWISTQLFTMLSACLYVALGLAVDLVNEQRGIYAWHVVGINTGPSLMMLLAILLIMWNTIMYPLAVMRFITPRDGIYGMSIVTVHFITLIVFLLASIIGVLIHINISPVGVPPFIHFFPIPGALAWVFTGKPPEPGYLLLATALLTFLAGFHIYCNLDWMQRKENEGRKLRSTPGSSMLA